MSDAMLSSTVRWEISSYLIKIARKESPQSVGRACQGRLRIIPAVIQDPGSDHFERQNCALMHVDCTNSVVTDVQG